MPTAEALERVDADDDDDLEELVVDRPTFP